MPKRIAGAAVPFIAMLSATLQAGPPPAAFVRTDDSDAWVARSFKIQARPRRVLVVSAGQAPSRVRIEALDLNARRPSTASREYAVSAAFPTLQAAADAAAGGDLVAVLPGRYAGFVLGDKADAGDGRYVHFRALGRPGEVTIDRPSDREADWMIYLQAAHHVVIQGFDIAGATGPGLEPRGPLAGIMIAGDFGRSGRMTHHVAIVANFSHNHRKWGLHSTDTHTVLLVARATELFGAQNFPDGRGVNFIIEENVINGNGNGGGGGLNLAGLQESLIQSNLIYGNFNHGIALWNDGNPYDNALVVPGPRSPAEVTGPEALPLWGCRSNRIRNNTVLMANPQRAALVLVNGSWGNRVRNNVLINDEPSSMEISSTSIYRLDSDYNVLNAVRYVGVSIHSVAEQWPYEGATDMEAGFKALAVRLDEGGHSVFDVTRARAAEEFVRYGEEPWVLVEGGWWRRNPARPDFRPRPDSRLLSGHGDAGEQAPRDLYGARGKDADIGALRRTPR